MRERSVFKMKARFWKTRGMEVSYLSGEKNGKRSGIWPQSDALALSLLMLYWTMGEGKSCRQFLQSITHNTVQPGNMRVNKTRAPAKTSRASGGVSVHILEECKTRLALSYHRRHSQGAVPIRCPTCTPPVALLLPEIQAPTRPDLEHF